MARYKKRFRQTFQRFRRFRPRSGGGKVLGMKISTLLPLAAIGAGVFFFKDKIFELFDKKKK